MKKIILITTFCYLANLAFGQEYSVDSKTSTLQWTGYSEVGNYAQTGSILIKEGMVEILNEKLVKANISFDTKSITSTEKKLEKHLKEKDFFWVKKYPIAFFKLIEADQEAIQGTLNLRGKTKTIKFPYSVSEDQGQLIIKGKITIDRTQFDIKYNSTTYFQDLGSYAIKNKFDLEFTLALIPK